MRPLSASLLPLLLLTSGCAGGAIQLPGTTKLLDDLPRVDNSTTASCRLQKQIAAQNSYLASIKAKKRVVYKAPCEVDAPKQTTS
jgi:hypothetical protein